MVNKFEESAEGMFRWVCLTAAWFHKGLRGNERKSVPCLIGHQSDESVNLSLSHTHIWAHNMSTCHNATAHSGGAKKKDLLTSPALYYYAGLGSCQSDVFPKKNIYKKKHNWTGLGTTE